MKNIIFTIILAVITLSCSKNDKDNQNNIPPELIGKWKITSMYVVIENQWTNLDSNYAYDVWYKENSTVIFTESNSNCPITNYSITGNKIFYSSCDGKSEFPYIIESLTESELIIITPHFEGDKYKYQKIAE
jgi:hypothetical protein